MPERPARVCFSGARTGSAVRFPVRGPDRFVRSADLLEQTAARHAARLALDVSASSSPRASASRSLISSQFSLPEAAGSPIRTSAQPPRNFCPRNWKMQTPTAIARLRVPLGLPGTLVPQDDAPCAILFRRNRTFEPRVLQWMVLHMDGQPLIVGVEFGPLGTAQLLSVPFSSRRKS